LRIIGISTPIAFQGINWTHLLTVVDIDDSKDDELFWRFFTLISLSFGRS
jgi:hypothetical protein